MSSRSGQAGIPGSTRSDVRSADGTSIAFDTRGSGPGLLVLSGSVVPPELYDGLARALASDFTVHVVHRRGRGASGPQGDLYGMDREIEDTRAVMARTGASRLFGHSFGGLVALQTALRHAGGAGDPGALTHIAAYEPPVSVDGSIPLDFVAAFDEALAGKRPALALTILNRGLRVGGVLDTLPAPVHRLVNAVVLRTVGRQIGANLRTVSGEAVAGLASDGPADAYASVETPTLILLGERGPDYFAFSAKAAAVHMHRAEVDVMPGLDHNGPMFHGEALAATLRPFLA